MLNVYGMRNRGFSIGCQPMDGLVAHYDSLVYHSVLVYDHELTEHERLAYELDWLGFEVRPIALKLCYKIPGFEKKPLPEKNVIYDRFMAVVWKWLDIDGIMGGEN